MTAAEVARTVVQLFDAFATRVAEILHQQHRLDPAVVLRVRRGDLTLEGLTVRTHRNGQQWYLMQPTREQLEWEGPYALAEVFVREYVAARSVHADENGGSPRG